MNLKKKPSPMISIIIDKVKIFYRFLDPSSNNQECTTEGPFIIWHSSSYDIDEM